MSDDPRKVKEGVIVNASIRWLILHGCNVMRNNSGALKTESGQWVRFGKKGSGDIIGCTPYGRYLEIECKRPGADLRPEQYERKVTIEAIGGIYIVVRRLEDLINRKQDIIAKPEWVRCAETA